MRFTDWDSNPRRNRKHHFEVLFPHQKRYNPSSTSEGNMRVEIRDRPYDLYTVIAASTLLVIIIVINEVSGLEVQALRVILGLPFILFIPGYVLISALYPEKKKYFDQGGSPISKEDWEKLVEEREDEEERNDDEIPDGKGLDGLERLALSLGLSIAITPLIGLVLNYTYDWDPDHLGIRLLPVLFSVYAFILITGIAAVVRRNKVPLEDRFEIVIDITIPEDYTTMDKVLTVGIAIMMVASVSLLIYIIVVPREGESFTEFYILGPSGKAEGYPRNMYLEEEMNLIIGVGNHEHERTNYTLVMTLSHGASNSTVGSYDNVTVSRTSQPSMEISVGDGKTLEIPCNFSILETGAFKLRFLLFMNGEEYRDLHIWIKVFPQSALKRSADRDLEVYLTGVEGDPSMIPDSIPPRSDLGLGIGIRNFGPDPVSITLEMSLDDGGTRIDVEPMNGTIDVVTGKTYTFSIDLNATSSIDVLPIFLTLPQGERNLVFAFSDDEETWTLSRTFMVGV
jgi:uncharacterized membrane protein